MNPVVDIKLLTEAAKLPSYSHPGDAGMDLCAALVLREVIAPGERSLIPCGIAIRLPANTEAQVRPRSGLAAKHGITVLNSPGTIDEGYRGEICVILINHGDFPFTINPGDRIAQMVIKPVYQAKLNVVQSLGDDTERGVGGMGSTGL